MNPHPPLPLHQIVSAAILRSFFISFLLSHGGAAAEEDLMESCIRNSNSCRWLRNISHPFWMNYLCQNQGFELTNCDDPESDPLIRISGERFRLVQTYQSGNTFTLSAGEFYENACPENLINVTLRHRFLSYSRTNRNLTLFYNCGGAAGGVPEENRFRCGRDEEVIYANDSALVEYGAELAGCGRIVQVQVNGSVYGRLESKTLELDEALKLGFDADYDFRGIFCSQCEQAFGGQCIANDSSGSPPLLSCLPKGSSHNTTWKLRLLIGGASAIVGLLILSSLAWKMSIQVRKSFGWVRDPEIEAFIRNHATLSPKRYRYSEVKGITSSFKHKLGQGGYGGVYEGKLEDGRLVAVKVLNTSKGNGQDFINEVASISRTSHVNVVSLLGFCLERKTRALIYEFMPNGSLDKFIFKRNDVNQHLGWNKLYDIALGIARGLEYLHQGCSTRIVHFDIKPHNILLDENFNPKISDFGLAKLCTRNESILSMMEARGTMGYIAPEVFSRNFGVVSHKSDVYSYGMMVLEMAGGRRNLDVQVSQTSEVYFPHLVYRHLEQGTQLKLQGLIGNEETEIVRKMIVVGLWCIQPSPSDRPSISKVIEMFEGSVEALQNPPNPFLSSPPRILQESVSAVSS